jgi:hypothetical protein
MRGTASVVRPTKQGRALISEVYLSARQLIVELGSRCTRLYFDADSPKAKGPAQRDAEERKGRPKDCRISEAARILQISSRIVAYSIVPV